MKRIFSRLFAVVVLFILWEFNNAYCQKVTNSTYNGIDAVTGKAKISFSNVTTPFQNDNILSRWQMQLGARYTF
jgi:hypothetical protein